jgi:hypothetical protein
MLKPRLISRKDARLIMVCDECGIAVPSRPWPEGWSGCGMSNLLIPIEGNTPLRAYWCPKHEHFQSRSKRITALEMFKIRSKLLGNPKPETALDKIVRLVASEFGDCPSWRAIISDAKNELIAIP